MVESLPVRASPGDSSSLPLVHSEKSVRGTLHLHFVIWDNLSSKKDHEQLD